MSADDSLDETIGYELPHDQSSESSGFIEEPSSRPASGSHAGFFHSLLREKDETIATLQAELDNLEVPDAERHLRATVIEITRKNRQLTAALQRREHLSSRSTQQAPTVIREVVDEYKHKYLLVANELQQVRNEAHTYKQLSDKFRRALLAEVGSEEALEESLKDFNAWKSRASIITNLTKQVNDLRRKQAITTRSMDSPNTSKLSHRSASRSVSHEYSQMQSENTCLKAQLAASEEKSKALRTRVKLLEGAIAESKTKLGALKEKADNDDKLIAELRTYIKRTSSENSILQPQRVLYVGKENEIDRLKEQCERQKVIIEKLRRNSSDGSLLV